MSGIIILQRRSSKIEVQLASFATFSAFEEHVGSKFEIDQGVRERGGGREGVVCAKAPMPPPQQQRTFCTSAQT